MDRGDWQATVHGVTMTERLIAHIARNCRRSKLVKTETTQRKKGEHSFMEERRKLGGVALSRNSLEKRRVGSGGGPNWLQTRAGCCCWVREELLPLPADPRKLQ